MPGKAKFWKDSQGNGHIQRSIHSPGYVGTRVPGKPGNQKPLLEGVELDRLQSSNPYAERFGFRPRVREWY